MNAHISLQARVSDYLAERRRLGFELRTMGLALANFARYVASVHHRGALTVDLMAEWARHDRWNRDNPQTWARRLKLLRPFVRYLRQFDPRTKCQTSWSSVLFQGAWHRTSTAKRKSLTC